MKKELTKDDVLRLRMVKRLNPKFDEMDNNQLFALLKARYPNIGTLSVICYSLKKCFDLDNNDNKVFC